MVLLIVAHAMRHVQVGKPEASQPQETNNGERVRAYLVDHSTASPREIAEALAISVTTANKWRTRIQGEGKRVKRTRARRTQQQ